MTFALPGVEEREVDSDGPCEQLSHLLQAVHDAARLSMLTVCNLLLPLSLLLVFPFFLKLLLLVLFLPPFFVSSLTASATSSLTHALSATTHPFFPLFSLCVWIFIKVAGMGLSEDAANVIA